jgi:hypothetical protein
MLKLVVAEILKTILLLLSATAVTSASTTETRTPAYFYLPFKINDPCRNTPEQAGLGLTSLWMLFSVY